MGEGLREPRGLRVVSGGPSAAPGPGAWPCARAAAVVKLNLPCSGCSPLGWVEEAPFQVTAVFPFFFLPLPAAFPAGRAGVPPVCAVRVNALSLWALR